MRGGGGGAEEDKTYALNPAVHVLHDEHIRPLRSLTNQKVPEAGSLHCPLGVRLLDASVVPGCRTAGVCVCGQKSAFKDVQAIVRAGVVRSERARGVW
jgi:hypothetical protein